MKPETREKKFKERFEKILENADEEYARLVELAKVNLTEEEEESQRKRERAARKQMARAGLKRVPVDMAKVRRMMVLFANGAKFAESLSRAGLELADLYTAQSLSPEVKMVREFAIKCRYLKGEMVRGEIVDTAEKALVDGLKDTSGETKVNAKLVEIALTRLDRERYGDDPKDGAGRGGDERKSITYNFPNMTNNWIALPGDAGAGGAAALAAAAAGAIAAAPAAVNVIEAVAVEAEGVADGP